MFEKQRPGKPPFPRVSKPRAVRRVNARTVSRFDFSLMNMPSLRPGPLGVSYTGQLGEHADTQVLRGNVSYRF